MLKKCMFVRIKSEYLVEYFNDIRIAILEEWVVSA